MANNVNNFRVPREVRKDFNSALDFIMSDDIRRYAKIKNMAKRTGVLIDDIAYALSGNNAKHNKVPNPPAKTTSSKPSKYNQDYSNFKKQAQANANRNKNIDSMYKNGYTKKSTTDYINKNVNGKAKETSKIVNQANRDHAWRNGQRFLKKAWNNPVIRTIGEVGIPYVGATADYALANDLKKNGHPILGTVFKGIAGIEAASDSAALASLAIPVGGEAAYGANMGLNATMKALRVLTKRAMKYGVSEKVAKDWARQELKRNIRNKVVKDALMNQHKIIGHPAVYWSTTAPAALLDLYDNTIGQNGGTVKTEKVGGNEYQQDPNGNQAREDFIKTLIDAGYSREEAEKRADEVEYGTGDKGTLTDGSNTEVAKYGYGNPNAVNTRYYGGGTGGSTGGATTGAATGVPQTTTTIGQQPIANQQAQETNGANKPQEEQSRFTDFVNRANDVYDSWQRSQQYYDPYRNSLNQYINNYRDIYDASMARNRWLSALRGESINPDKFSPLDEEANRIALQKQLASELESQENSRNELIGNLGVASEMGLPPESVNASDKYLQSATKYREEEDKIEQRRENQRLKYQTSLEIQQLKGEVQRDIAAGNLRAAAAKAEILKQKNQILYTLGLFTPAINAMPYMDDYSTLLDIMGRTPVGQYFVPQQQIQPVQQVQVQARPQQPKAVSRAISADQFVQRFK